MDKGPSHDAIDHLLGELEAPIMRQMWARETATVRQVLEALQATGRRVAYTTVMTVMGRLHAKGLLARDLAGKTHVYRAALNEEQLLRSAAARRVQELVVEFGDVAIAQFLAEVDGLSPARRRQLEKLADGGA
ncbi:MAG: BlaI/MecI/CopY family transcriptional regulator [Chloroflexia bacterium]|nr:BlaI/MecI/CopY family transcriptional regulator [Chloroflexia bacterium]